MMMDNEIIKDAFCEMWQSLHALKVNRRYLEENLPKALINKNVQLEFTFFRGELQNLDVILDDLLTELTKALRCNNK